MSPRLFIVDVEATGPSPARSVMTEFGVVDFATRAWFHGHLWDFHPDPEVPARPVADQPRPGFTATTPGSRIPFDGVRRDINVCGEDRERRVYSSLISWLRHFDPHARAVLVSDNPGFDAAWMTYGFDSHHLDNPFGHSSRRIGDLAAGLAGNWQATSRWKRHRRTRHDHNPVNDALGNAEALETVLRRHDQKLPDALHTPTAGQTDDPTPRTRA